MLIVGLTGSIGAGKSTAAARFRHHGIGVFDADAEVHRLYEAQLVPDIGKAFPTVIDAGTVNRGKLSRLLVQAPDRLSELEKIVHPHVRQSELRFLQAEAEKGASLAVLEIPLLLEVGADSDVDVVIVVSASRETQRERVLQRPGMTFEKLETILSRQMPDAMKRQRGDFIVDTNGSIENCNSQIDAIVAKLPAFEGNAFGKCWRA